MPNIRKLDPFAGEGIILQVRRARPEECIDILFEGRIVPGAAPGSLIYSFSNISNIPTKKLEAIRKLIAEIDEEI